MRISNDDRKQNHRHNELLPTVWYCSMQIQHNIDEALSIDILTSRQNCIYSLFSCNHRLICMQIERSAFLYNFNFQIEFLEFSNQTTKTDEKYLQFTLGVISRKIDNIWKSQVKSEVYLLLDWTNVIVDWVSKWYPVWRYEYSIPLMPQLMSFFFGTFSTFSCNMIAKVIKTYMPKS